MEVFLLAATRSHHLGIHHAVSRKVPNPGARVCHVSPRRIDLVGCALSRATGHYVDLAGGRVGEKPRQSIRESAQAQRVSRRSDAHQHP